jgi:hypothetical protein
VTEAIDDELVVIDSESLLQAALILPHVYDELKNEREPLVNVDCEDGWIRIYWPRKRTFCNVRPDSVEMHWLAPSASLSDPFQEKRFAANDELPAFIRQLAETLQAYKVELGPPTTIQEASDTIADK